MFENPNYLWALLALPVAWAICVLPFNRAYRVASLVSSSAVSVIVALLLAGPTVNFGIGVEHPLYLWLLALLPILWFFSFKMSFFDLDVIFDPFCYVINHIHLELIQ